MSDSDRASVMAEYVALRSEILLLIQARNTFWLYDLAAFGAVFVPAISLKVDNIFLLIAPLIHYPLMMYWAYADTHIVRISHYIKDHIEPNMGGMGWERHIFASRLKS